MRLHRAVFLFPVLALAAYGCGGDKNEEALEGKGSSSNEAKVPSIGKLPDVNSYRMRPSGGELEELFAAEVGEVKGQVNVKTTYDGDVSPAKTGDTIYGGGYIETTTGGSVKLAVREIGNIVLDQDGLLLMSPYTRCGALLAKGGAYLKGTKYARNANPCFLHTTQVAIMAPGQSAVIEAGENGQVYLGAPEGAVTYVDIQGNRKELGGGQELLFPGDDQIEKSKPFKSVDGEQLEKHYQEWRKIAVVPQENLAETVGKMIEKAEVTVSTLDAGVDRLIELKELNKNLSRERRILTGPTKQGAGSADGSPPDGGVAKGDTDKGKIQEITASLVQQAKEMLDLQEKGSLQIHRILAICERASKLAGENQDSKKRIEAIRSRLESMKDRLPQLFQRIQKRAFRISELQPGAPFDSDTN